MDIGRLADMVRMKESLKGISKEVVVAEIEKHIRKERMNIDSLNEKDVKIIVHDVRAVLRKMSGSYVMAESDESHVSAVERRESYSLLKDRIFSLSPKSILDLGCGLNPLEIARQGVAYYAYDIDESAISKVNSFFKEKGIDGTAKVDDVRTASSFPKADVCLLLKVLDVIDAKGHKNSEQLIRKIECKYLIISFSTRTLSGAPMRHPQRGWIERLLSRLGFEFESFSGKNEIFYVAKHSV